MNTELLGRLQPFRDEALRRGIPSEDIERWIATARPSGTLVTNGDGPVVGRFGGPVMLPVDTPDPWEPLLATLDCAALPEEVTGLPLPPDGHLLLFGFPEVVIAPHSTGEVVYIPAGTPVEERKTKNPCVYGEEEDDVDEDALFVYEQFPKGDLRLSADVSLPYHHLITSQETPFGAPLPGHPRSYELAKAWRDTAGGITMDGTLHIGGYGSHECVEADPVVYAAEAAARAVGPTGPGDAELSAPEDWVLLAQWDISLDTRDSATLHWVIPLHDLAARRFERTHVSFFWNP
ncbi:DUF1963 domain-containing protein [Streptomyces finlayi]|uniref:DUF1963 domain-containing protein n=1 Tax=Streptomyces finlayi TaxID=67296 RepID=A0A7G7BFG4_9ACTN|nr:DUF1963 domain-containing protein [Streptomyces finlayi]QNE74079.1 DUF1963 domain-containing protein [Streptomyces finlayi]